MPSRAAIVGCGYVGLPLARALADSGVAVTATTTRESRIGELEATGATAALCRIEDPPSVAAALSGADLVYLTLAPGRDPGLSRPYLAAADAVLDALDPAVARRLVFTSATSVYGQDDGSPVDEESPTEPTTARGQDLLAAERRWLAGAAELGLSATVLRLAGIWGPGRDPANWMTRGGPVRPGHGEAYLNLIHRDDIVEALVACAARPHHGTLNLAIPEPPTRQALYAQLAAARGLPAPTFAEPATGAPRGKRVLATKALGALALTLRHPLPPT